MRPMLAQEIKGKPTGLGGFIGRNWERTAIWANLHRTVSYDGLSRFTFRFPFFQQLVETYGLKGGLY